MAYLSEAMDEDQVKRTPVADLRKAYLKMAVNYNHLKDCDYLYCHKCNSFLSKEAFYRHSDYASGYFPVCNRCLAEMATDYDKKENTYKDNKDKTINTLHFMDLPYIASLYESAMKSISNEVGERTRGTAWKQMIAMVLSLPQYRGKRWKDSEFDEEVVKEELAYEVRKDILQTFGSGFTPSDYMYLQNQYDDWKARTQVDSKSQETYIVQICFKQLEIWKAQKAGKDTDKLIKSLNDLMASANLQPRQNVSNAATDSLSFGQLIEKWELEEPIPDPEPEFKDVDGIGKYLRVWFSGHLGKAVGLKNANTSEYEEEMKKYTVDKPGAGEDDSESSDEIYDKIFGMKEG